VASLDENLPVINGDPLGLFGDGRWIRDEIHDDRGMVVANIELREHGRRSQGCDLEPTDLHVFDDRTERLLVAKEEIQIACLAVLGAKSCERSAAGQRPRRLHAGKLVEDPDLECGEPTD